MHRLKTILFGRENRISRQLIISIIAFSSVITLILTVGELVNEYRVLRAGLDRELDSVQIHVPSLSRSAWDFDEKQIRLSIDALALLPNVDLVTVSSAADGATWTAGKKIASSTVRRDYPLTYRFGDKVTKVGNLEVIASLSGIRTQVAKRALYVLLGNGVKTFLVALFMAYLFQRLVTSRLERLSANLSNLANRKFRIRKSDRPDVQPIPADLDELQVVEWILDRAASDLSNAVASLEELNDELGARVAEKEALLQNALVGIVLLRDLTIVSCNRRFEEIFGYGPDEMNGQSIRVLYPLSENSAANAEYYEALSRGTSFSGTLAMVRNDKTRFWGEISGRAINPERPYEGSIWVYADVTERKQAEEKIKFIAYHDTLTALPNRLMLKDRYDQAAVHASRTGFKVGLLFLDLDNFKTINDSLGHSVGDNLIQHVALRLKECVHSTDTVSRHGGDEFLIVLRDLADVDEATKILSRMIDRLALPFEIEGQQLDTSVSIGAALFPDDGSDFDTLMKKADMAMYRAKDAGRNTYRFFDEHMNIDALEQMKMRNGLRRALERNEFVLHYQPQVELSSGRLIGVEALIRWDHPEFGLVYPGRFIQIAEDSGLIVPVGEWVMREACRQAVTWHQQGFPNIVVAVNLSAVQFKRGDLVQTVVSVLQQTGINPSLLELELTESIMMLDTDAILATVKRLKLLGVKLSIDDFGTGYSSLSYLKRFQVDKLKIDQSFVRGLAAEGEDAAIVRAIIQMAKSLGLSTIAEGIEDAQTLALLQGLGCDEAQGYYFARPMPAADFPRLVADLPVFPNTPSAAQG